MKSREAQEQKSVEEMDNKKIRQKYNGKCCSCGAEFLACKSLGIEIGWLDTGYGTCIKCDTSLALKFDDENKTVSVDYWDNYRAERSKEVE